MRRAAIVVLVSILIMVMMPASVDATTGGEYESPDGTYGYSTHGSGTESSPYWSEILYFECEEETVFIQSTLEGYTMTTVTSLSGCSADTVVFPRTLTTLPDGWYDGCSATTLVFLGDRPDGELPDGVTVTVLEGTGGWDGEETIPLKEYRSEGTSLTYYVLDGAAYVYGMLDDDSIVIPDEDADGVPFVGVDSEAFRGTGVTSIELGANVAFIGTRAFYNCTSLETAVFGGGLRDVRDEAFRYCTSLADVDLEGVVTIGFESFRNCESFNAISIPDSVTSMGGGAFYICKSVTSVTLGSGIDALPERTFGYCSSLETIDLTGMKGIGNSAFINCTSLSTAVLDGGTVSIGRSAFSGCTALTEIDLGSSLESIGSQAFYECRGLRSLTLPATLREIGSQAFFHCRSLDLYFEGDMPEISGELLYGATDSTVHVNEAHLDSWASYDGEIVVETDPDASDEGYDEESDEDTDDGPYAWIAAVVVIVAILAAVGCLLWRRRSER